MDSILDDDYKPPDAGPGDHALAVVQEIASAIVPGAGALLRYIMVPPLERRREELMKDLGAGLRRLEAQKGLVLDDLRNNAKFIDVVLEASAIALRTSSQAKKDALRNAILNSALPGAPDDIFTQIQLARIARYTEWHLRILLLLQAPDEQPKPAGFDPSGMLAAFLELSIPELRGRADAYDRVWKDLFEDGLLNTQTAHLELNGTGIVEKRTSAEGDEFLQFVKEP